MQNDRTNPSSVDELQTLFTDRAMKVAAPIKELAITLVVQVLNNCASRIENANIPVPTPELKRGFEMGLLKAARIARDMAASLEKQ